MVSKQWKNKGDWEEKDEERAHFRNKNLPSIETDFVRKKLSMLTEPLQISSSKMDPPSSLVVLLAVFPAVLRHREILQACVRTCVGCAVGVHEPPLGCPAEGLYRSLEP